MNGMWERRGSTRGGGGDSLKGLGRMTSGGSWHRGAISVGSICGQRGQMNEFSAGCERGWSIFQ